MLLAQTKWRTSTFTVPATPLNDSMESQGCCCSADSALSDALQFDQAMIGHTLGARGACEAAFRLVGRSHRAFNPGQLACRRIYGMAFGRSRHARIQLAAAGARSQQ